MTFCHLQQEATQSVTVAVMRNSLGSFVYCSLVCKLEYPPKKNNLKEFKIKKLTDCLNVTLDAALGSDGSSANSTHTAGVLVALLFK